MHPLTPTLKVVIATESIRRAREAEAITVTVVPVLLATNAMVGTPREPAFYDEVRIVTYR